MSVEPDPKRARGAQESLVDPHIDLRQETKPAKPSESEALSESQESLVSQALAAAGLQESPDEPPSKCPWIVCLVDRLIDEARDVAFHEGRVQVLNDKRKKEPGTGCQAFYEDAKLSLKYHEGKLQKLRNQVISCASCSHTCTHTCSVRVFKG